ncbi:MAG: class B sortase [Ruminococcus sp.]|nr:class B sortase [Ruminococcus sp.]MCM1382414.1 class B sortase [Muribaculaceae bacterium]MCM1479092.1 class B sortase [Muribaculaceae bacterium]
MAGYNNSKKSFAEQFLPQKGDSKPELIRKIVTIVAVVVLIAAVIVLAGYFSQQARNRRQIEELRNQHTEVSVISHTTTTAPETEETVTETEPPPLVVLENMESLVEQNPNVAGWLTVANTNIDNVVLQTTDNNYYMDKDFYGNYNIAGQVFVDYRCNINDYNDRQSDNVVVYGHNQADGTMFGTLKKYKIKKQSTGNFSFYQQNPTFKFSNLYEEYTYKIIAIFVIEVLPEQTRDGVVFDYHNYVKFGGERNFDKFKENILARTAVNTGVDFDGNDKFMTLSTCSNEFTESRLVVIGRRVRDGESPEVDTSKAEINEDMLEPDYEYIYNK